VLVLQFEANSVHAFRRGCGLARVGWFDLAGGLGGFGLFRVRGGCGGCGLGSGFHYRGGLGVRFALGSGGLEFQEEIEAGFDIPVQARFAEGEEVHGFGVDQESVGVADGVFDFDDVVVEVLVGEDLAVGEGVLFDSLKAVESPAVEGYGSCEVDFGAAPGVEVLNEFADEVESGYAIFVGHDVSETGDRVFEAEESWLGDGGFVGFLHCVFNLAWSLAQWGKGS